MEKGCGGGGSCGGAGGRDSGGDGKFAAKLMNSLIQEKIFVRMPSVKPLNSFIRITAGTNKDLTVLDDAMNRIIKNL